MDWHFLFHSWGKWEQYTENWCTSYIYSDKTFDYSKNMQKRKCLVCGKEQREEVK